MRGELSEEVAEVVETALAGDAVDRIIRRNQQVAGVADAQLDQHVGDARPEALAKQALQGRGTGGGGIGDLLETDRALVVPVQAGQRGVETAIGSCG